MAKALPHSALLKVDKVDVTSRGYRHLGQDSPLGMLSSRRLGLLSAHRVSVFKIRVQQST